MQKPSFKLNFKKIILIFLCIFIVCAIPQLLLQLYSLYLGGIPTIILYGCSFYLIKQIAYSNIGEKKNLHYIITAETADTSSTDRIHENATPQLPVPTIFSVLALIVSICVMAYSLTIIGNQQEEISLLKQELVEAKEKLNELPKNSIDNMDELKEEVSSLTLNKKIINSRLDSLESTVDFLSDHYLYNK